MQKVLRRGSPYGQASSPANAIPTCGLKEPAVPWPLRALGIANPTGSGVLPYPLCFFSTALI